MKIREDLENKAQNILIVNDGLKIPTNLIKIAKNNGIEVFRAELDDKLSGAIRYDKSKDNFTIILSSKDSDVRQRFTLAHELGHYFLHKDILESEELHVDALYRTENDNKIITEEKEREVDYFAGALLMNRVLLEKLYKNGNTISDLAKMFEVSESAMTVRLDILGVL